MKPLIFFIAGIFTFNQCFTQNYIDNSKKVDSLFTSIYNDTMPGVSVGIIQEGKKIFEKSYGISNTKTKEKLTASSNFNICSLTKQFTALAILQLEQKHLLSFNDHLSRFFPHMDKYVANKIIVQQLLTHSSGIPDHYDYTSTTHIQHAHDSDVYNAIKNIDSTYFVPGTKFQYSNTAYCLLALIIEKLSGISYNEYLQKNIFKPAGMQHTLVWNEHASISDEVTGYSFDSATNTFNQSGANEHIFFSTEGDGGIYTSVHDYMQWFAALQNDKIFSKSITAKARTTEYKIDSAVKAGYGYGWFIDEQEKATKVYHSGDNGGFRTYSFTIPSENFLIVIFSNRNDVNIENIVQQIVNLLLPAHKNFTPVEIMTS